MTNQTTRVLELLKRFNNNQRVCISHLQTEYLWEGKNEKTIRRDLDVIKSIFPESFELIRGDKGCYKAITKKTFDSFLTPKNISLLIQTFNIAQRSNSFDSFDIDKADKSIIESKIKESKKIYEFKNKPFESKSDNHEIFHQLEQAIYHQKTIMVNYDKTTKEVKPYKILFMNENFYLAGEVDAKYIFSLFRISKITEIKELGKNFHQNIVLRNFIVDMQTPFPLYQPEYKKHLIEVILEAETKIAYYFKNKNFLKSQKIIEIKENGNLLISYRITQDRELEELIMKWLPYLRVIEPASLREKIEGNLRDYLVN